MLVWWSLSGLVLASFKPVDGSWRMVPLKFGDCLGAGIKRIGAMAVDKLVSR